MSVKDWKTDIKVKLPRIHLVRPKDKTFVVEGIVSKYFTVSFFVSFLGWWKIYELIEPFLGK